jgi:hypothetical protein
MPVEITVTGLGALRGRVPAQAALLMRALREVTKRQSAEGCVLHVV